MKRVKMVVITTMTDEGFNENFTEQDVLDFNNGTIAAELLEEGKSEGVIKVETSCEVTDIE